MWHVSSRSGVATLQTAIHLLLIYTYNLSENKILNAVAISDGAGVDESSRTDRKRRMSRPYTECPL